MKLISTGEAALFLGVHPMTLHKWHAKGLLLPVDIVCHGQRLYEEETIKRFAAQRAAAKSKAATTAGD